jgi:DNA-binding response OmpR family regulator
MEQHNAQCPDIFYVDKVGRLLFVYSQHVKMSAKLYRIFLMLYDNMGQVIPSEEIYRDIFPDREMCQNLLSVYMYRLRKKLEQFGAESWVQSVHGVGYRLDFPFQKTIG